MVDVATSSTHCTPLRLCINTCLKNIGISDGDSSFALVTRQSRVWLYDLQEGYRHRDSNAQKGCNNIQICQCICSTPSVEKMGSFQRPHKKRTIILTRGGAILR